MTHLRSIFAVLSVLSALACGYEPGDKGAAPSSPNTAGQAPAAPAGLAGTPGAAGSSSTNASANSDSASDSAANANPSSSANADPSATANPSADATSGDSEATGGDVDIEGDTSLVVPVQTTTQNNDQTTTVVVNITIVNPSTGGQGTGGSATGGQPPVATGGNAPATGGNAPATGGQGTGGTATGGSAGTAGAAGSAGKPAAVCPFSNPSANVFAFDKSYFPELPSVVVQTLSPVVALFGTGLPNSSWVTKGKQLTDGGNVWKTEVAGLTVGSTVEFNSAYAIPDEKPENGLRPLCLTKECWQYYGAYSHHEKMGEACAEYVNCYCKLTTAADEQGEALCDSCQVAPEARDWRYVTHCGYKATVVQNGRLVGTGNAPGIAHPPTPSN
ncbi:MAG: hypothetical protein PHT12_03430 [Patescibacteria group bacterium]|nr:hypothetical protein [Patescibacteria group bacterium]